MSTVINTPDGIAYFQLLSIRGRLKIEVETGLGSRVSSLKAAKQLYGIRKNTKKGALAELEFFRLGWEWARGMHTEEEIAKVPGIRRADNKAAFVRGFDQYHSLTGGQQ